VEQRPKADGPPETVPDTAKPVAQRVGHRGGPQGGVLRRNYRLVEKAADDGVPAFYCFAVAEHSHVQIAFYFDAEQGATLAGEIWRSLRLRTAPNDHLGERRSNRFQKIMPVKTHIRGVPLRCNVEPRACIAIFLENPQPRMSRTDHTEAASVDMTIDTFLPPVTLRIATP
jgi:hypothetical protein